jgi:site-specific DNA-methyltransferase (adenine-specific)
MPKQMDQAQSKAQTAQLDVPKTPSALRHGDCLNLFQSVAEGTVDLVFADPPFNIGYAYDVYRDRRTDTEYLDWCRQWILQVRRVLKPDGTFWLAIGDEFAAELKLIAQHDARFVCRSWVIWYYTFGVNCVRGFSRSHTHLFHFVVDPRKFTFNGDNPTVRVPSARQLVYADLRANPKGRLPDNTWIYRPQDAPPGSFGPQHDTWYFSRVAGTFREREGFHGCQMPEQLLGRVIRVSSNPRDLVLDPFAGSGTTLVTAKKLGRRWLGFELSSSYAERIQRRLDQTVVGAPLDGPENPIASAPKTSQGKKARGRVRQARLEPQATSRVRGQIVEAYQASCRGESIDAVLCDPELNAAFLSECRDRQIEGAARTWNRLLLANRKAGRLSGGPRLRRRTVHSDFDQYSWASEIAMQTLAVDYRLTLDELLCEPEGAAELDRIAATFAPGFTSFEYRWGALSIRKRAKRCKALARGLWATWHARPLPKARSLERLAGKHSGPGVYVLLSDTYGALYVGETRDIAGRLEQMQTSAGWQPLAANRAVVIPQPDQQRLGLQSLLIHRTQPLLNSSLLRPDTPATS